MSPLRRAWADYRDAVACFSRPARLYLSAEMLAWSAAGMFQVLYNLYLVEAGYGEAFVGRAISMNGAGLAIGALPAGLLADRIGRVRCLLLGALLDGLGMTLRASLLEPGVILGASLVAGVGQSLIAVAGAPFLAEHSTPRERTHLFSAYFATALIAGIVGSALGGWVPALLLRLPATLAPDHLHAYRGGLLLGAGFGLASALPFLRLRGLVEPPVSSTREPGGPPAFRLLFPTALNSLLIGLGAGLVIPFMNLYFKDRFGCSSARIGAIFAVAQVFTAAASLLGPTLARRFGKLRTATASELLSLPFLVTLGAERSLGVAAVAFWLRATLMQASTPLINTFVMEVLPPSLRARSTSLNMMVWNAGWAVSATLAGAVIQRFGYAVPFYFTAVLYATAAATFFLSFRGVRETAYGGSAPSVVPAAPAPGDTPGD